jgi:hypothetical protein
MPSYKLGTSIKQDMVARCRSILTRQRDLALQGMPVTHEQFQASALPDAKVLATLQDLTAQGVQGPIRLTDFSLAILTKDFPGLKRDLGLYVTVPEPVFMARHASLRARHGRGVAEVVGQYDRPVILDPTQFDTEQAEALVAWANNVVRVKRVGSMVQVTVNEVLGHVTTTGHIIARWPVLTGLVEDKKWQLRLRMKPERLGALGWPHLDSNGKVVLTSDLLARMRASEPVLIMAQMLTDPKPVEGQTKVQLLAYQSFDSDRFNE